MTKKNIERKTNGRPSSFKPEFIEQACKLALLGATDKQMADFFGVKEQTLNNWKKSKDGFFASLKKGKLDADANVSNSLYKRALGLCKIKEVTFERVKL